MKNKQRLNMRLHFLLAVAALIYKQFVISACACVLLFLCVLVPKVFQQQPKNNNKSLIATQGFICNLNG